MNLRDAARGRPCTIRLSGICNGDSATTVLAHWRQIGISGMGIKSPDAIGAWACSSCHAWIDSHHDLATKVDFAEGVFRTQAELIREGVLRW